MKGFDISAYTTRFSDLALLCSGMVTSESNKVERYICGLTPPTQGNVLAANPLTFDSAKRLAHTLIDHGVIQGSIPADPEKPKEGGSKNKFWQSS